MNFWSCATGSGCDWCRRLFHYHTALNRSLPRHTILAILKLKSKLDWLALFSRHIWILRPLKPPNCFFICQNPLRIHIIMPKKNRDMILVLNMRLLGDALWRYLTKNYFVMFQIDFVDCNHFNFIWQNKKYSTLKIINNHNLCVFSMVIGFFLDHVTLFSSWICLLDWLTIHCTEVSESLKD